MKSQKETISCRINQSSAAPVNRPDPGVSIPHSNARFTVTIMPVRLDRFTISTYLCYTRPEVLIDHYSLRYRVHS